MFLIQIGEFFLKFSKQASLIMTITENSSIQEDHEIANSEKRDDLLCDLSEKLKYQKSLFLDQILINENVKISNPNQSNCVIKRYFSSNLNPSNTDSQFQELSKESKPIMTEKIPKLIEKNPHVSPQNNHKFGKKIENQLYFPHRFICISNNKKYKIYDYLFQITGAYLTQNELIFLRKTVFKNVLPLIIRDEQRSKIKNIECFEKYSESIISLLQSPGIQFSIQNFIFNRRRNFEKSEMILNFENNLKNQGLLGI